jgi:hypothetical protein
MPREYNWDSQVEEGNVSFRSLLAQPHRMNTLRHRNAMHPRWPSLVRPDLFSVLIESFGAAASPWSRF